jgi:hypothetical protein
VSGPYTAADVERDRWGRPLIVPPEGGKPRPYTRASTLAKALDKGEALSKWKQRQTALGLAARHDLFALVQALDPSDKGRLDEICEDALVAAGGSSGANLGTALHALTEAVDEGIEVQVTPELRATLDAYRARMDGIKIIAREVFVVNDELEVAGSFDKMVEIGGEIVVADVKTGQWEPKYPHATAVQIAIYANGTPYGSEAGRAPQSIAQMGASLDRGLMIHLPSGQAVCDLYWMDIKTGWTMAKVATGVRRWYSTKPIEVVK